MTVSASLVFRGKLRSFSVRFYPIITLNIVLYCSGVWGSQYCFSVDCILDCIFPLGVWQRLFSSASWCVCVYVHALVCTCAQCEYTQACAYLHMDKRGHTHTYTYMCACRHARVWRPEAGIECFPRLAPLLIFETLAELVWLTWLASGLQGSCGLCPLSSWDYRRSSPRSAFYVGAGNQSVPHALREVLGPLSHLSNLLAAFRICFHLGYTSTEN